jgi:alpha-L-fucosidase
MTKIYVNVLVSSCLAAICVASIATTSTTTRYKATWESLDSRPLPQWYDDAKIGIFIHFGVYSVPSFKSEWFWWYWKGDPTHHQDVQDFMNENYPPGFTYQDFARDFRLEFFNATEWVKLFEQSGAKYAVLTSKHHEGFTLWPSPHSFSWNSVDVGPRRDIVGEFSSAVKKSSSLRLGLYHSFFEWFNPLFALDSKNNFTTRNFFKGTAELYELVKTYKPDLIWSDGDPAPPEYWQSKEFLAWLYNESPVKSSVVVNDRWGLGTSCKHGGFLNCADRYKPDKKVARKWENAMTLDTQSWGYRRNGNLEDYLTAKDLIRQLADTVSKGGNLLVDVGPTKEGTIPLLMQERLLQMGTWLKINGEAVS